MINFRIETIPKAAVVGIVATLLDLSSLWITLEVLKLPKLTGNLFGLFLGGLTHFIGSKLWVFSKDKGRLSFQAIGFAIVELLTLALNAVLFQILSSFSEHFVSIRLAVTCVVFWCFTFPLRATVFRRSHVASGIGH